MREEAVRPHASRRAALKWPGLDSLTAAGESTLVEDARWLNADGQASRIRPFTGPGTGGSDRRRDPCGTPRRRRAGTTPSLAGRAV